MKKVYGDEISSIAMPCFVIFVLAYLVATLFMALFETTIDTIFLCFLIDEELNKASGQMFASPSLQQLVDAHATTSAEMANTQMALRQQKFGEAPPEHPTLPPPTAQTTSPTQAPSGGFVGGPTSPSTHANVF